VACPPKRFVTDWGCLRPWRYGGHPRGRSRARDGGRLGRFFATGSSTKVVEARLDEESRPSFQALHHQAAHTVVYYAFDVLHLDGRDLTATPLDDRRDLLARVLHGSRLLR
jgi:ATP dependent DNA ligase domain